MDIESSASELDLSVVCSKKRELQHSCPARPSSSFSTLWTILPKNKPEPEKPGQARRSSAKLENWASWPPLSAAVGASVAPGLHTRSILSLRADVSGRAETQQYAKPLAKPVAGPNGLFFEFRAGHPLALGLAPPPWEVPIPTNPAVRYSVRAADESRKPPRAT